MSNWQERIDAIPYWYHKIELPGCGEKGGCIVTPGWAPIDANAYAIPADLTGKRVLDVGAWDGYWTFEALKRGAKEVVAIDDFSDNLGKLTTEERPQWKTFDLCREALGYGDDVCKRQEISVYNVASLGKFDVIFFFGTIYHLKYPQLALDTLANICTGSIHIESAICDKFSPYRSGLNHGYEENDVVMEFYPGSEYGNNKNNWWVPSLRCLGSMVQAAGFEDVHLWGLSNTPHTLAECRGFSSGTKDKVVMPASGTPANKLAAEPTKPMKVAAVMTVPRIGFQENMFTTLEALIPLGIHLYKTQGAFWGQQLELAIQKQIDDGADAILTLDYDTVYRHEDVADLINLMKTHPEATAIAPIRSGRDGNTPFMTMKDSAGHIMDRLPKDTFDAEITRIHSAHFGMTLFRVEDILKIPHPWFRPQPDEDGLWGDKSLNSDMWFWKLMEEQDMVLYSANRVVVGYLDLALKWPDINFGTFFQHIAEYKKTGKHGNVWK